MTLSRNMVGRIKTHYISLLLLALLAFANMPRMVSICLGADGALRTGIGCQCPACDIAFAQQGPDSCCGYRATTCANRPNSNAGAPAGFAPQECCAGFQLAQQLDSMLRNARQATHAPQHLACAALIPSRHARNLPAPLIRQCSQPPGRARPGLLRSVILRV